MKSINWDTVEDQKEYKRLCSGGYICKITSVEDVADKEYLKIEYDIFEGEYKGYYKDLFDSKNFWGGNFIRSYKETAQSFFKGFITALEKSNKGYKFDNDETKLVGKLIGLIISEEEYQKNDGSIGIRFTCNPRSVDIIRTGAYEVPELKVLKDNKKVQSKNITPLEENDELPF